MCSKRQPLAHLNHLNYESERRDTAKLCFLSGGRSRGRGPSGGEAGHRHNINGAAAGTLSFATERGVGRVTQFTVAQ